MADERMPDEAAVREIAERQGLVLMRSKDGRYDFHDDEIDQDVSTLGGPDRWRWRLPEARHYLEREGWVEDRALYREATDTAHGRGWHLVNDSNGWIWSVRDAKGSDLAKGPFRTCVKWLRERPRGD